MPDTRYYSISLCFQRELIFIKAFIIVYFVSLSVEKILFFSKLLYTCLEAHSDSML